MTYPALTPDARVGDIADRLPGAAEVFRRHGISFCCGGKNTLAEAANAAQLPVEALADELQALIDASATDAPEDTAGLIDHVVTRYHQMHRTEFEWLVPLAQKVEMVHGDHDEAPLGLTVVLERLRDLMEEHMDRQEQALFPMMREGGRQVAQPLDSARAGNAAVVDMLRGVEHATHGLTLPEGACRSWTALYTGLSKLTEDIVRHVHIENEILFPRFEAASV